MRKPATMATPITKEPRNGIQVITRAAAILRALERSPDGLSLGEIAKAVDLPRSTVQRIVDALDRENLVLASSTPKGVRLGPALVRLAAATRFEVRDLARPIMDALAKQTGETIDLAIFDQDKVVFVDQVLGTQRLTTVSSVGGSFPLHCSANGKAMLATLGPSDLARLRRSLTLTKHTKHTITSWAVLEDELERIRSEGVAYDREENSVGICAVAMALRSPTGELAAISAPVPAQRFAANESALVRALRDACDSLQREMRR